MIFLRAFIGMVLGAALACAVPGPVRAQSSKDEAAVGALIDRLRDDAARLRMILQLMPKGGDLHNHLSGTPYPEDYLRWAGEKGLCIDADKLSIVLPPCTQGAEAAGLHVREPALYDAMVDSLSTRAWQAGVGTNEVTGHEQFFATFEKFGPAAIASEGESIAMARRYAGFDNVLYLELINYPGALQDFVFAAGDAPLAEADFENAMAEIRLQLPDLLATAIADTDAAEALAQRELGCASNPSAAGCDVTVRYNGFVLRGLPPRTVFRMMAVGFALAAADPRYVGMTIVAPEDGPVALMDYDLHMAMFAYFGKLYPDVRLSPHAGELALGQVPPADLRDHIAKAIAVAGADRIGHGTGIAYETKANPTLKVMAEQGIAVEINLTSNDVILGVTGSEQPLRLYLDAGVPVILSTDDEGVLRIDLTNEYRRAVMEHGLSYAQLKDISRAGIEYSFLANSEKAELLNRLNRDFAEFEQQVLGWGW